MNLLMILSALYGLAGALYVVAARLRLHLMLTSGRNKIQFGQFPIEIDGNSTEVFIDVLGFVLIGLSFAIAIIAEFAIYENVSGFLLALITNSAAILAVFFLGFIPLTRFADGIPTSIPPNVRIKSLAFCIICADILPLISLPFRIFHLGTEWVAFAGLFGASFSVQYVLFPLLLGVHRIQGGRTLASPRKWFAASILCIALGVSVFTLVSGSIEIRAFIALAFWLFGMMFWFLGSIVTSF